MSSIIVICKANLFILLLLSTVINHTSQDFFLHLLRIWSKYFLHPRLLKVFHYLLIFLDVSVQTQKMKCLGNFLTGNPLIICF